MTATPPSNAIEYFDRYDHCLKTEAIFGDRSLNWAYGTTAGRLTVEAVAKRIFFSKLYGWWVSRHGSRPMIPKFIDSFNVDPDEFVKPVEDFESFNDFFVRELTPEARPIDPEEKSIVFPADGRHLGFPDLAEVDAIFAKGQSFDLPTLLGDAALAEKYKRGSAVVSRLCPVDYHRFHFCADGHPGEPELINGVLYSVNPIALRRNIGILNENRRVLTCLKTDTAGEVLILEIGATNVGSIRQTFSAGEPVSKGEEKGFFAFGGSMTILFFEPGRIQLANDLLEHSGEGRELYARMGDRLGAVSP